MLPSNVGKLTARYGGHRVRAEAQSGRECGRFAGSVQYSLEHRQACSGAPQGSPEIGKWEARDSLSLVAHH